MLNQNVTGRDSFILAQALIYAIEVISRLPPHMQSGSNMDDMKSLLMSMYPKERDRRLLINAPAELDYLMNREE